MSERVRRHDDLGNTVKTMQAIVAVRLNHGCLSLSWESMDKRYIYDLTATGKPEKDLLAMSREEIAATQEWTLLRSDRQQFDGSLQVTMYSIDKNDNENLALVVTQHLCPLNPGTDGKSSQKINDAWDLQVQVGLALPEPQDYVDIDNALHDFAHRTRLQIWLKQVEAILPYSRAELTNPN